MNKAYLNCIDKTLSFSIENKSFKIDLTEGDLADSWGAVKFKTQIYDTNFSWEEGQEPLFSIYPVVIVKGEGKDGEDYLSAQMDNNVPYEVVIEKGGFRDYYSTPFPNGILSYTHTFGVMCDNTKDTTYFNEGRIATLERLSEWAWEFETQYQYENWEETQWDETLDQFLIKKLA